MVVVIVMTSNSSLVNTLLLITLIVVSRYDSDIPQIVAVQGSDTVSEDLAKTTFTPIQRRLDDLDLLNEWTTPIGSAVFAVPPGCDHGGYIGETLLG